jgi:hypothetical protein
LTFSASSLDISRPALIVGAAGRGSSIVRAAFAPCFVTVDAIVVANAVGSFSAVRKSVFACLRSYDGYISTNSRNTTAVHTWSRIRWKSKTLSAGSLHASHSRYHFFSRTGLPKRQTYFSFLSSFSGSRSPSSAISLFVRTRVVRLGTERWIEGEIEETRLLAKRRVFSRRRSGRLPRTTIELSVKSIASCWSYSTACKRASVYW